MGLFKKVREKVESHGFANIAKKSLKIGGNKPAFLWSRDEQRQGAQQLYKDDPFAFSHLPEWVKRDAFEADLDEAADAEKRVAWRREQVAAKRGQVEGLKKQLTDEKGNGVYYAFADTNARAYQKLLR